MKCQAVKCGTEKNKEKKNRESMKASTTLGIS